MYKPVKVTKHDPKLLYQFLKRLNTVIPYGTEIPLLDKYPREMKYTHTQKHLYIDVHISIIHNSQKYGTNQNVYQLING